MLVGKLPTAASEMSRSLVSPADSGNQVVRTQIDFILVNERFSTINGVKSYPYALKQQAQYVSSKYGN